MKHFLIVTIVFLVLLIFISTKKFNKSYYNSLVLSLKSNLKKDKEIDNSILQTNDFMEELFSLEGKNEEVSKIHELVVRRTTQHKGQFLSAKRKLKKHKGVKFLYSDSIGLVLKGVHFIDIALIYKAKHKTFPGSDTLVIVYEMFEVNKDFRMNDDIYTTNFTGWSSHVKGKKELYNIK